MGTFHWRTSPSHMFLSLQSLTKAASISQLFQWQTWLFCALLSTFINTLAVCNTQHKSPIQIFQEKNEWIFKSSARQHPFFQVKILTCYIPSNPKWNWSQNPWLSSSVWSRRWCWGDFWGDLEQKQVSFVCSAFPGNHQGWEAKGTDADCSKGDINHEEVILCVWRLLQDSWSAWYHQWWWWEHES